MGRLLPTRSEERLGKFGVECAATVRVYYFTYRTWSPPISLLSLASHEAGATDDQHAQARVHLVTRVRGTRDWQVMVRGTRPWIVEGENLAKFGVERAATLYIYY